MKGLMLLKIINIKKGGKDRYVIELEDGKELKCYDSVILNNSLLFKTDLSEELIEKIANENEKEKLYHDILQHIYKKTCSKQEIINLLKKKDVSLEEEKHILEKLEKDKLINDEWYTRAYIQDHMNLFKDGPLKIKECLLKEHSIKEEVIDKYLSEVTEEEIFKKLEKLIIKRVKNNSNKSLAVLKNKIVMEFIQLGYEKAMIDEIMYQNLNHEDYSVVTNEYRKLYRRLSLKYKDNELSRQIYYKLKQKGFSDDEIKNIEY